MSFAGSLMPRACAILAAPAVLAGGLALAAAPHAPLALINESPSVPKGLYVKSRDRDPRPGRLVSLAQPEVARAYLASLGMPPEVRLLKRVAAVGGETICAGDGWLRTSQRVVAVSPADRRGVALPVWRGCRVLAADELLVLGDTPSSFDGRYFGPVTQDDVDGPYEEIVRW